jgi:hypothetical protein
MGMEASIAKKAGREKNLPSFNTPYNLGLCYNQVKSTYKLTKVKKSWPRIAI